MPVYSEDSTGVIVMFGEFALEVIWRAAVKQITASWTLETKFEIVGWSIRNVNILNIYLNLL
jgi:hypothetical protein